MNVWIILVVSAGCIIFSGARLTSLADRLSERLNLGRLWIGVVLLGVVTSLPEAIACYVSVSRLEAYDLAVGNLLGSNNFNPMLIVVMDAMRRDVAITNTICRCRSHQISIVFIVLMTCMVIADIFFHLPLNLCEWMLAVVYLGGVYGLSKVENSSQESVPSSSKENTQSLTILIIKFLLHAMIVVAAAYFLTEACDTIARITGMGGTFVGTILLAMVTSLPEMVVTITAMKMVAIQLAFGNIFGSNMINLFFIPLCSLMKSGAILHAVSRAHIVTAVTGMLLLGVVFVGIGNHQKKKIAGLGWDSWIMLSVFIIGNFIVYTNK